jgi:Ca2+-binding RTX toxin-like protein
MAVINGDGGNNTLSGDPSNVPENDSINGAGGNDVLDGKAGRDTLRGGSNNDDLQIAAASDVVAGEIYDGGGGFDRLLLTFGTFEALVDLTGVTLTGLEELFSFAATVRMTAAQVDAFTAFDANDVAVTTGGAINLTNLSFYGSSTRLLLSAAGNSVDFGVIGGFRWSSQRLGGGGCDGCSEAAFGPCPAGEVPLAWRAGSGTA